MTEWIKVIPKCHLRCIIGLKSLLNYKNNKYDNSNEYYQKQ